MSPQHHHKSAAYAQIPTEVDEEESLRLYPLSTHLIQHTQNQEDATPTSEPTPTGFGKGYYYNYYSGISDLYQYTSWSLLLHDFWHAVKSHPFFRPLAILLAVLITSLSLYGLEKFWRLQMGYDEFVFEGVPRPGYLDLPMPSAEPLVIRLGIMCRVDGWEKRSALREAMLSGVSDAYVKLEYKFFVGTASNTTTGKSRSKGESAAVVMQKVREESEKFGDMVVLEDVEDVPERISEKRFQALRWGASAPKEEYDYFMTMDSDSFCRLRTLAQRLSLVYSNLKPRQEPILVGNMGSHDVYWENTTPPDGTKDGKFVEDVWFTGPRFPYPVGIGYMLSSDLTATILTADPPLPHHINYPYDDVMIGSWMAALKSFHNASTVFESPKRRYMPKHQLHPKPYLPYVVEARLIDDKRGWHDFWHRGALERSVSWDTACVHRIKPTEMRRLRGMREVSGEWEDVPRRL